MIYIYLQLLTIALPVKILLLWNLSYVILSLKPGY